MTFTRAWLLDALERVVRAFLVAFCGVLLASKTGLFNTDAAKAAASAGIASGLSVVLSLLGAANGSGGVSPASLAPTKQIVPRAAKTRKRKGDAGLTALGVIVLVIVVLLLAGVLGTTVHPLFWLLLVLLLLAVLL